MKIALAQMKVIPGSSKKNLATMLRMIKEAKQKKVDLVAFPEMSFGYLLGDKWLEDSTCLNLMEFNEELRKASNGIAVAYGNIFLDKDINKRVGYNKYHPNKDGRTRKYNAIYVFQNGEPAKRVVETNILPQGVQTKTLLPNYRFFDDERYFFSTEDIAKDFNVPLELLLQPFLIKVNGKNVPIGFELCEDLWCEDYRKNLEALNPTKILINNGAEYIINISASPWTYGKNNARDRRVQFLKLESGEDFVPFLYVNCVGTQNNGKNFITFDGGSTVYNKDGLPIKFSKAPYLEELIIVAEEDLKKNPIERIEKPKIAQKYDALIEGISHIKDLNNLQNNPLFVIGLSGGVDSAVTAALVTKVVGKEKVLAINMPTKYNSEKTKSAAFYIAEKLGIAYEQVPIQELVDLNEKILENLDLDNAGTKLSSLNKENIQAKIRGTSILSNIAAKYGALFTNNGNKLETALGYATLYGDVGGAINILGDLTKAEVFDLAKYLNKEVYKDEIIPEILLPDELFRFRGDQIQPSAELKDNQVDPMKFGYHCALLDALTDFKKRSTEDIMNWYIDGTLADNLKINNQLIKRWNIYNPKEFIDDLEWFTKAVQRNVFKRIQAPPIIATSKSAYGYDIRESMLPYETTLEHDRLKNYILEKVKVYTPKTPVLQTAKVYSPKIKEVISNEN